MIDIRDSVAKAVAILRLLPHAPEDDVGMARLWLGSCVRNEVTPQELEDYVAYAVDHSRFCPTPAEMVAYVEQKRREAKETRLKGLVQCTDEEGRMWYADPESVVNGVLAELPDPRVYPLVKVSDLLEDL